MSDKVKVRELFYINNKKLLNRVIAVATWLPNMGTEPVSHTSLWEPDCPIKGNGKPENQWTYPLFLGADEDGHGMFGEQYVGQCWTSTTRKTHPGDKAGTKVRPASQVLDHPENWYYTEHEVLKERFEYAKRQAQKRVDTNKGYSIKDLSRFIMPLWMLKGLRLADSSREICSEHVETWARDMDILEELRIRSPRRLCKQVVLATGSPLRRLCDDSIVRDGIWKRPKKA